MTARREFLKATAAAGGAAFLANAGPLPLLGFEPQKPLDLLILGGTGFIGPHLVRLAVERGHRVTTFTRGRRQAELPDGVTRLIGDRNGQLQALEGGRWDAVIDASATNPDWVRASTQLLKDSAGAYLFTSSTGAHYPYLKRGLRETDPVRLEITDPKDGSESYGVRKAQCDAITLETFGNRGLVIRPGYIVGPGDTTDRFPYWPVRLAQGGETLAPGRPDDPVQIIDVRDLVAFMLSAVERGRNGIYNATGPADLLTFGRFLERAAKAIGSTSRFTWVGDHQFLKDHGIEGAVPWIMLEGNDYGHTSIRNDKARAAGLSFRPLEETVKDTLAWWPTVPAERRAKPRFAVSPETEAKALADWKSRG